jgi:hypothetical protein
MKCRYCLTDFHAAAHLSGIGFEQRPFLFKNEEPEGVQYQVSSLVCSKCFGAHLTLYEIPNSSPNREYDFFPAAGAHDPAPPEVPAHIAQDYTEANLVLTISPKASAALARRCLQAILASHGYVGRDLVKQITSALNEQDASKSLPTALRENIDAIRNFGNFSAHPITDQTTLQVVDVEEGEAEWCLQLLQDMFDHYYVAPARAAEKRANLAAKLSNAGKPPMLSK